MYKTLAEVPVPIDLVDVFRRSEQTDEVFEEAMAVGEGHLAAAHIVNEPAAERARAAGMKVVMNRCPKIESPRLGVVKGPTV